MKLLTILLCLTLYTFTISNAQWRDALYDSQRTNSNIDFGFQAGMGFYHGELQRSWFQFDDKAFGGGLYFKRFFNKSFGFRTSVSYYKDIRAFDSNSVNYADKYRNLRFHTNYFEGNLGFEINLVSFGYNYHKFTPFIHGGFSIFYFNPWTDSIKGAGRIYLQPLGTEGQNTIPYPDRKTYSLISSGWTFGGGFKGLIANKVILGAEVQFRYANTDYIDDVSRTYVNLDTLAAYKGKQSADISFRSDELETFRGDYPNKGFMRGDPNDNDWIYTMTLTVGIYFDTQTKTKRYPYTRCIDRRTENPTAF